MKTCIVGTGALGGLMGAKLALAGKRPTLIDRGPRLHAIRTEGLRLIDADGTEHLTTDFSALDDFALAGAQDVVILAVKAYQLASVAPQLGHLFHADTVVVTVQNGIPWWYFQRHGGELDGTRLQCLDPDGILEEAIPAQRIIGGVAYPAAEAGPHGVVRQVEGDRFALGELDGEMTPRAERITALLDGAGFRSRVQADIRAEIWLKALGSVSFNPISALTGATMAGICRAPATHDLVRRMMEESEAIAHELGITLRRSIDRRMAGAEAVGEHRTSMLQDLEAGRRLEIDALVAAVAELGRLTGTPTPHIDAVYACVKLLEETRDGARHPLRAEASGPAPPPPSREVADQATGIQVATQPGNA